MRKIVKNLAFVSTIVVNIEARILLTRILPCLLFWTATSSFLSVSLRTATAFSLQPILHIQQQQRHHTGKIQRPTQRFSRDDQGTLTKTDSELLTLFGSRVEDIYSAVHRKEYEMKQVKAQHRSTTDPVRMAMGYAQESAPNMLRLAAAMRRVHDDPTNPANIKNLPHRDDDDDDGDTVANVDQRTEQMNELGLVEMSLRRGSFIADIKRQSLSRPGETLCRFDDAGAVAQAMVRLGADVVFINTDYAAYGGDMSELKSAVQMVRKISKTAAVVMKDIVVDEIQLGLAKEAGADGILLMSSVLGPALDNFLNLATVIGLETIVECHTKAEVERALFLLAPNILVNNYDRITQRYYPQQAIQLAGLFPGSGGPVICLATGDIQTPEDMKRHLAVGYDGIVIGKAIMGNAKAPELIRACRDRTLLPAELSQWGLFDNEDGTLDSVEFDPAGNVMTGPKRDIPSPDDTNTYQ